MAIPTPDTTPPTAMISTLPVHYIRRAGRMKSVTVTYTDNAAINVASIAAGNVTVTDQSGNPLRVTGVEVSAHPAMAHRSPRSTPLPLQAACRLRQTTAFTRDQYRRRFGVKDTSNNGVVAATGNVFQRDPATLPDTTPPNAQITAANITTAGAAAETITIVYTDNVAVKAATIVPPRNIVPLRAHAGPLTVLSAQTSGGDGSPLLVTYTVGAPHGTWSSADNGNYTIALQANQVSDLAGNFANGVIGSFAVNIATPIDTGPSDPGFNNGQTVSAPFVTEAMVTQPDGKILAVGREGDLTTGTSQGVIERFNADGTVDTSFGTHGMIVSAAGANEAYLRGCDVPGRQSLPRRQSAQVTATFLLTQLRSSLARSTRPLVHRVGRSLILSARTGMPPSAASQGHRRRPDRRRRRFRAITFAFARFDASGNLDLHVRHKTGVNAFSPPGQQNNVRPCPPSRFQRSGRG